MPRKYTRTLARVPEGRRPPEPSELWRLIPLKDGKPLTALTFRQDWYHLVFYDENDKSVMKNLWTKDPLEAQRIRDDLYRRAKRLGRGSESAIEAHASKILWEIEKKRIPFKGLIYQVQFANQSGAFKTREEAIARLKQICLGVKQQQRKAS